MTPVEVMARAAWDPLFWGTWENAGADGRAPLIDAMRAALLALAEIPDTPLYVKDWMEEAANEGKTKAEIAKPILDGMVARGELLEPK